MKKRILCLLCLSLLLACVPTPEEEIVVNKGNQNAMIGMSQEEVKLEAAASDGEQAQALDYETLFGIPKHLTLELSQKDGVHAVSIDADITVPEAALPVMRVFSGAFDQTIVTACWHALVGDTVMYRDTSMMGKRPQKSKAEIAEDIKELTALLDRPEHWSDRLFASREEIEAQIEDLKTEYKDAPDDAPREVVTDRLITETLALDGASETAHRVGLHAYNNDNGWSSFTVENDSDNKEPIVAKYSDGWGAIGTDKKAFIGYHRKSTTDWTDKNNVMRISVNRTDPIPDFLKDSLTVTPDEAAAMPEAIFREAGIDDTFRITEIVIFYGPHYEDENRIVAGYEVHATRYVNGAPMLPLGGVYAMSEDRWSRSYTPYWCYETVEAGIDNNGIFDFGWHGPLAISDTITSVSSLLPFAKLFDVLETRLPITEPHCSWDSPSPIVEAHATVSDIRLGLWLVREQNELGKGLLVPCYGLYGTYTERREDWQEPQTYEGILYLINAVDGSLIDPEKGY